MKVAAANLERWMETAVEAAKIAKRGMKEVAKEAEVKAAAAKYAVEATNYVSYTGALSADIAASTAASAFVKAPTYYSSVVGVARRSGYTLIIIML